MTSLHRIRAALLMLTLVASPSLATLVKPTPQPEHGLIMEIATVGDGLIRVDSSLPAGPSFDPLGARVVAQAGPSFDPLGFVSPELSAGPSYDPLGARALPKTVLEN